MMQIRKSEERGRAEHDWLSSRHTFSFAEYRDPRHMGFGPLRVINEDKVQGGQGFGTHGHQDMEIISYVLDGALEHRDSMGNGSVLRYGDVQRMSAGTGVRHSEFNHSPTERVHFLQIWVMPDKGGLQPGYEEKHFDPSSKRGQLRLVVSPDGRDGSLRMNQDAFLFATLIDGDEHVEHTLAPNRQGYVHVARGTLKVNGVELRAGDALKIEQEQRITLDQGSDAEVLLFDLP
ncbi:redox-sensitive bicupin YhaK (pirin superfamily) [Lysobacter niabensis]|uniref:Redox-sensitive bicupin YhaK (Pirin superfamily) n=1 Tax=Agrilutibacter niabensis TaxID=380628 RepID=A0ABU1VM05_9GAMM|nr:pirin family protein [Lysobacter niabensis]MDR7098508.1 redox-sensitive bicupin YhaK (pirin superfamily) [Lysobacter niabensis]